jgi:hypothetical protein
MPCLIESDHDEFYETLHHSTKKARKQFRCCECRDDINKGDMYDCYVGAIDDRIDVQRTCLLCESISKKFLCNRPYEGMYEEIYNAIDSNYDLENCILMMASKDEYNQLIRFVSFLDQNPYGEDEEEDE